MTKERKRFRKPYNVIRAGLIHRGTSLARWARENGYPLMTAYQAARGERQGKVSLKIRAQLEALLDD